MLNKESILSHMRTSIVPDIYIYDSVNSTNIIAKNVADNSQHGTIILANTQTSGYGRFGKTFESPNGGLYMSIILKQKTYTPIGLTAIAVLSVCNALDKLLLDCDVQIKWLNDVVLNNRKVCGISCESRVGEDGNIKWFVIGIGLNIRTDITKVHKDLFNKITSLKYHTNLNIDINKIVACIADRIIPHQQTSDTNLMSTYQQRLGFLNKKIEVTSKETNFNAIAKYVNEQGQLIVNRDGENIALNSQEYSIKI
ncbi:MAG: biotin--[acetyl-CoA-carboxylase] ligase [Firmicutes bacterium]|nr:biotin--[acetyl-CoA-carboxylase] ligase [Bacillota bacterium]MCL1953503.1 biotin--[acetyl-CoA-carboxylase] ligase [Bacillota bacterium]